MTSLSVPPSSPQSGKSELDATPARFRRAYSPARLNAGLDRIAEDVEAAGVDVEGLKLVMKAVEEAPADEFDMSMWECGTTRCGIGWFCRKNPGDALRLEYNHLLGTYWPYLKGQWSFDAISDRFRITDQDAHDLFDFGDYEKGGLRRWSKTQFLEKLEQFITDHTPKPAPRLADLSGADYAAAAVEAEEDGADRYDLRDHNDQESWR